MGDAVDPSPNGSREAKSLILIVLLAGGWILVAFHLLRDRIPTAALATAYLLPLVLVLSLFLAIRLASKGTAAAPLFLVALGIAHVAGGGTFDMIATVLHSPGLELEGNVVARTLLDSGHALWFVYTHAIFCQGLYIAFICASWIALLRHRETVTSLLQDKRSFPRFVKAATGGDHLGWRQWMLPLRLSDLPRPYPLFWVFAVVFVAGEIDRWYLGLEWFGLVPQIRYLVSAVAVLVALAAYLLWLWTVSRRAQDEVV